MDERTLFEMNKQNVQLCEVLRDGVGPAEGSGLGLGAKLRKDKMARLEARVTGADDTMGEGVDKDGLSRTERAALLEELEELKRLEGIRQRRQLLMGDGEGALAEDDRGLGISMEDKWFGGKESDGDSNNASGGEGNPNRELNRRKPKPGKGKEKGKRTVKPPKNDGLQERMRRRNIEFELRYGSHRRAITRGGDLKGGDPTVKSSRSRP